MTRTLVVSALSLLLVVTACADEHNPPLPGDGDGTGDGDGDGDGDSDGGIAVDAAPDGLRVSGIVCANSDLRDPEDCPTIDLTGTTVTDLAGNASASTTAAGTFTIYVDAASSVTLVIAGPALRTSMVTIGLSATGATGVLLPAVDATYWAGLVTDLVGVEPDQSSGIVTYLVENDGPAIGAEIFQPTAGTFPPFYEDGSATDWNQVGLTGNSGAALLFGVLTVNPTVSFNAANNGGSVFRTVSGVPVAADTTSFVWVDLTP